MPTKTKTPLKIKKSSGPILEEIDKALEIASFYGFSPIQRPATTKKDSLACKDLENCVIVSPETENELDKHHRLENKLSILRNYIEGSFKDLPFPLMISFRDGNSRSTVKPPPINLSIVGTVGSIAETLAIKTTLTILKEEKQDDLETEINYVGDKDCFNKFERDFITFLKKNSDSLPKDLIESTKSETGELLSKCAEKEDLNDLWASAPKPLNYLSSSHIQHFKEVLENLESLETPYNLNHFLIPNIKHSCFQTVFQIKSAGKPVAIGVRHSNIIKRLGFRRDIPLLTVVISDQSDSKSKALKRPKSKFFLVHFGYRAKIKSLIVIEILRKAGIPILHLLTKDKLVGQLSFAESLEFSYILIIGEKEALEDSVVVRNSETRVQETVPTLELANYLKKIKI